ncbi:MAG TPA: hypothetical protein VGW78_07335 [Candidatus Babeliales bacterium]|jgi:hypothetical protein|nr:hypothetical protein [Candidatus Babeliales bacterium]
MNIKFFTIRTKKKNLLPIAILLSTFSITYPIQDKPKGNPTEKLCKMPSEEVLRKRICPGREHFCEKVSLCKDLADQERYPLGIAMAVELAIADYETNLRKVYPGYSDKQKEDVQSNAGFVIRSMHIFDKEKIIKDIVKVSSCNCNAIQELIDTGMLK